jgi:hypothetical protein
MKSFILWTGAFVVLTILTQIGGIALILAYLIVRIVWRSALQGWRAIGATFVAFAAIYAAMTFFIVPPLAALGGRVQLPCSFDTTRSFGAANPIYCVLNRNYATPELADLLVNLSRDINRLHPGTRTLYLDANFPFISGFPLLPHLSHNDGRKLDLAFYYADNNGTYQPGKLRSPIGYWAFEFPVDGETSRCRGNQLLTLRWDMALLQPMFTRLAVDTPRTKAALNWLFANGQKFAVERIFVEPHLAARLGVFSPILGFQGCRAARHDDHMHLQIKR